MRTQFPAAMAGKTGARVNWKDGHFLIWCWCWWCNKLPKETHLDFPKSIQVAVCWPLTSLEAFWKLHSWNIADSHQGWVPWQIVTNLLLCTLSFAFILILTFVLFWLFYSFHFHFYFRFNFILIFFLFWLFHSFHFSFCFYFYQKK